ncbi:MAG TPA: hypothetical protein VHE36_02475 [Sphingomicrobium sp.]|nr:hypothetical protein [Sphingomicrobium sp.]
MAVNISHEGSSIVTFADAWPAKDEPESEPERPLAPEWLDYWRSRERKERAAAKNASSADARRVHQELAQAYALIVRRAGWGCS